MVFENSVKKHSKVGKKGKERDEENKKKNSSSSVKIVIVYSIQFNSIQLIKLLQIE